MRNDSELVVMASTGSSEPVEVVRGADRGFPLASSGAPLRITWTGSSATVLGPDLDSADVAPGRGDKDGVGYDRIVVANASESAMTVQAETVGQPYEVLPGRELLFVVDQGDEAARESAFAALEVVVDDHDFLVLYLGLPLYRVYDESRTLVDSFPGCQPGCADRVNPGSVEGPCGLMLPATK